MADNSISVQLTDANLPGPSSSNEEIRTETFNQNQIVIEPSKRKPLTPLRVGKHIWSAIKYIYSCALLGITLGVCFYSIGVGSSDFFSTVPIWLDYILFVVFILYLGVLEGIMISLSQVHRAPTSTYAKTHNFTFRNASLALRPDYLEKFLMGRQANVIVLVFMLSRLLSDGYSLPIASWIISGFLQTGLFGSFIVLILGNLVPQVTAAKFPFQFLNFSFIYFVIQWCLFICWIGLPHACWLCAKSIAFCLGLDWNAPPIGFANPINDYTSQALLKSEQDGTVYGDRYEDFFAKHALSATLSALKAELPTNVRDAISVAQFEKNHQTSQGEELRWPSRERIAEIFCSANEPVPGYLIATSSPSYVPPHISASQLLAENQRLLRQLKNANINPQDDTVKAPAITIALKPIVEAAALDRLKIV